MHNFYTVMPEQSILLISETNLYYAFHFYSLLVGPSDILGIDLLNILSNKMEIFVLIIHVIILSVSNSISFSLKYYLECNFFSCNIVFNHKFFSSSVEVILFLYKMRKTKR